MNRFRIIPGTKPPDTPKERVRKRLRAAPRPANVIACPRCSGIETIETRIGVTRKNGKTRGGTKVLICANCLRNGERVVLS